MNIIKILYKSFDNKLSIKEESKLKKSLLSSSELARKKEYIEKLRIELAIYKTKSFSVEFESKVKQKIQSSLYPQIFIYNELKFAFRKIVYVSALATLVMLGISFINQGYIDFDRILGTQKVKIEDALYYEFSSLDKNLLGEKNGL